jgi:hypothetical protein
MFRHITLINNTSRLTNDIIKGFKLYDIVVYDFNIYKIYFKKFIFKEILTLFLPETLIF